MDPKPVTNSSSSSSEQNFFCGIVSCNSVPSKRQQSDCVPSSSMDNHSRPFKQFDIVSNCSDHHFAKHTQNVQGLPNAWMKKIMQEWKILDADLPGPAGTPYHDGLFFFDFQFTDKYPNEPPHFEVFVAYHFYTHGLNMAKACEARSKECLQIYKVCFKKRADKVLKEYKAREVAYRKKFALKDKAGCTGGNDGTNSGVPNKANNKLKCFCYYLLKLGKKLLPMGN
ncbi:uncharacterized protein A4U43_C09F8070 [Asparagus officinalis]|uniref:UBC core domain-containing protein n=1 Tax=Asparagus officinalis TaxID=4686 RepID=A0A5P1EAY6_ASPOF|nr:uncharacterized protein A4U43_C09F8070 [Asparagus officinalis]